MVTWPINAPHRVENTSEISISLVMEYFEPVAWYRYAVYYTNGIMRRRFSLALKSIRTSGPVLWMKAISSVSFKLSKIQKKHQHRRYLTFRIDPQSEFGYSDIPKTVKDY